MRTAPPFRLPLPVLAFLLLSLLPGCASSNLPGISACRGQVAGGVALGVLAGILSNRAEQREAREEGREARTDGRSAAVVGGLMGGAMGYGACVQAYRQRQALNQRFERLEARLRAERDASGLQQTSSSNGFLMPVRYATSVRQNQNGYATLTVFSGPQLFDANGYDLTPDAQQYLLQIANQLVDDPDQMVVVSGFAYAPVGTVAPAALSQRRADAAATYLRQQGVAAEQISAYGLGNQQPLVAENAPDAAPTNNRIEVVLIAADGAASSDPSKEAPVSKNVGKA